MPVDNLATSFLEGWFHEADADGDGRVADEEARAFFLRTNLSPAELSTVWRVVKPPTTAAQQGKGLTKRRFSQALRLIAMVQNGIPLTPELATAALSPESWSAAGKASLPAPQVDPLPLPPPPPTTSTGAAHLLSFLQAVDDDDKDEDDYDSGLVDYPFSPPPLPLPSQRQPTTTDEAAVLTGLEFLGIEQPPPPPSVSLPDVKTVAKEEEKEEKYEEEEEEEEDDDLFNLAALKQTNAAAAAFATPPRPLSFDSTATSGGSGGTGSGGSGMRCLTRAGLLKSHARNSKHFVSSTFIK